MCDVRPNCFTDNFFLAKQRIQKNLLRTYIVNSWLINNESAIIYVSRFSNGEYLVRCICQMQLASPSNLKQKECVYSTNQLVHTKITRFTYTTINYFVWIFKWCYCNKITRYEKLWNTFYFWTERMIYEDWMRYLKKQLERKMWVFELRINFG